MIGPAAPRRRIDGTFLRFAVVLGMLSAVGPLAIDMYLPALADITRDLHTDQAHVGMTLMSFFIGLTVGQPVYGPISDRVGRRAPLLMGLSIYLAASILCALAPSVGVLIGGRLLQGLGAGAGLTISAAIVRDIHTGEKAVRLLAARTLVIGVSPILAPVLGASIIAAAPWRYIFVIASGCGALALALVFLIPETHSTGRRSVAPLARILGTYVGLFADRGYIGVVLAASCVQCALIAYITGSPFVLLTIDQVSPLAYGVIFACNGGGYILAAQLAPMLMRRLGALRLIRASLTAQTGICAVIVAEALLHDVSLPLLLPMLFLFQLCTGSIGAPATVLALSEQGSIAGLASGLMMTLQLGFGAAGSALASVLSNGTALPMAGVMALASACALAVALKLVPHKAAPASATDEREELLR